MGFDTIEINLGNENTVHVIQNFIDAKVNVSNFQIIFSFSCLELYMVCPHYRVSQTNLINSFEWVLHFGDKIIHPFQISRITFSCYCFAHKVLMYEPSWYCTGYLKHCVPKLMINFSITCKQFWQNLKNDQDIEIQNLTSAWK